MSRLPILFCCAGILVLSAGCKTVSYDLDDEYRDDFKSMVKEYQGEAANLASRDRTVQSAGALPQKLYEDQVFSEVKVHEHLPSESLTLEDLFVRALQHSSQIRVFSELPLIRETGIQEAAGAFDTNAFVEAAYDHRNDPVGSTLTTGNASDRFRQDEVLTRAGAEKKLITGTEVTVEQRVTRTDNNSSFFVPNPQTNAELSLTVMQPLLRGAGIAYNRSIMQIATIDSEVAMQEFIRQSESHLLEIARTYWTLYAARATYLTKKNHADSIDSIITELEARQEFDAARRQLLRAEAAGAERRAELVRSEAAVRNAEDRLKALVNDPQLRGMGAIEIVPEDPPSVRPVSLDLEASATSALQRRPEILQAFLQLRAGAVREKIARNEVLPELNMLVSGYVAGLASGSRYGEALTNQFDTGGPGVAVGMRLDFPIENNEAEAKLERRKIELRQLFEQLKTTMETVLLEVKVAAREVRTSLRDVQAKYESVEAAREDVVDLERRKELMLLGTETGSASYLEFLLEAQDRQADAEEKFLLALATYNVSLLSMERAKGNLLNYEDIRINRREDTRRKIPMLELQKDPSNPRNK